MRKYISQTIAFTFINRFTKKIILDIQMPYIPFEATNGKYSKIYRRMKVAVATGFEGAMVKGKVSTDNKKTTRTLIRFDCGASIDMPNEVSELDIKIIKHYLAGVKMALKE